MKVQLILIGLLLTTSGLANIEREAMQSNTPSHYGARVIKGCSEKALATQIESKCNRFFKHHKKPDWSSAPLSQAICKGNTEQVGQNTTYHIWGNAKHCPGNAAIPMVEGWQCHFTVDQDYNVTAKYAFYVTCMG